MLQTVNTKKVLLFAAPPTLTMLFIAFNVIIDGILAANLIDELALSAINIVIPLVSLTLAIGLMLGSGGNAICSKLLGEGKAEKAKEVLTMLTLAGVFIGLLGTLALQLNMETVIRALGANEETLPYAMDYMRVFSFCFPLLILDAFFQNMTVTAGKSVLFMVALLVGGVFRAGFGFIFIYFFNMGIEALALSTAMAYLTIDISCIVYFFGKKNRVLHFVKPKFDAKVFLKACTNGSSEMVTNLSTAVSTYLFNRAMLLLVGNDGVAAISVMLYAQLLLGSMFMGYTIGVAPLIGFNYGAQNGSALYRLFRINLKLVLSMSLVCFFLSLLLAQPITELFTEPGTAIFVLASEGLRLFAFTFLCMGFNVFASGMFTAYSNGKVSAIISFLRTFLFISTCILILPNFLGVNGVWLAVPIAEALTAILVVVFFQHYKKPYQYAKESKEELSNV